MHHWLCFANKSKDMICAACWIYRYRQSGLDMANGHTPGIVCVFAPFCGHKLVFMHLILPCTLSIFQWENFSGQVPTESLRTQDSENVYERWVQQIFDPVSVGRSWMSAKKWGPLAKLWAVTKKSHAHNFQIWASKFKSLGAIVYGSKWFTFGSSNSKIVGVGFFCNGSF